MTRTGIVFVTALLAGSGAALAAQDTAAKPAKVVKPAKAVKPVKPAKPAKPAKPEASAKASAPAASAAEINKLKGDYKWAMTPDEVLAMVQEKVRAAYQDRLNKSANDPSRNDRLRKEMAAEVDKLKGQLVKFDDQKTGYDVSIVDQEFLRNAGEAMLVAKEDSGTRYFFFRNGRLYKMFLAFDKEILQGKSFADFGKLMQQRFGKAREVTVEEKNKAGVRVKLDHFIWSSKGADTLRLVDRSEFYDVYCLVIYDAAVAGQQQELRQARATGPRSDSLIDAVTSPASNERDPNDNIIDRISGKPTLKPGEQQPEDVKVPSVTPPANTAPVTPPSIRTP